MEEKVAKLFLIRHGETNPKYKGRYIGASNVRLSPQGFRQAKELGEKLKKILSKCAIFVSPALRCRETWEAMKPSKHHHAKVWDDLREVNFGEWEGKNFKEIETCHREDAIRWKDFDPDFCFPGGESLRAFTDRMNKLQEKIMDLSERKIVLVTHGGVISALLCIFLGLALSHYVLFRFYQPSVLSLEIFENGKGVLTGLNLGCSFKEYGWLE